MTSKERKQTRKAAKAAKRLNAQAFVVTSKILMNLFFAFTVTMVITSWVPERLFIDRNRNRFYYLLTISLIIHRNFYNNFQMRKFYSKHRTTKWKWPKAQKALQVFFSISYFQKMQSEILEKRECDHLIILKIWNRSLDSNTKNEKWSQTLNNFSIIKLWNISEL